MPFLNLRRLLEPPWHMKSLLQGSRIPWHGGEPCWRQRRGRGPGVASRLLGTRAASTAPARGAHAGCWLHRPRPALCGVVGRASPASLPASAPSCVGVTPPDALTRTARAAPSLSPLPPPDCRGRIPVSVLRRGESQTFRSWHWPRFAAAAPCAGIRNPDQRQGEH